MSIWKHGRFVDLWSVVHVGSGMALALSGLSLGYGFWASLSVSAALLVAWEVFEWAIGIIEPSMNVSIDLVLGALGIALGAYAYYSLDSALSTLVLAASLITVLVLSVWGFIDFSIRGYH